MDSKHEYAYHPDVDEDDKIVGRVWTRRQTLAFGGLAGIASLIGCGGGGGGSTSGVTGGSDGGSSPSITTQPSSLTVSSGSSATFSVVASGTSLAYQWYRGGVAISGATSASYTLSDATSADGGATFFVKVSNSSGAVQSSSATLTVASGINLVVTPEAIEGPFFVDENLNRSNLVTPGASRNTVANGYPLALTFTLYDFDTTTSTGVPMAGAHVDIWHADTIGAYSDEASGSIQSENTQGQTWLRGYQVTDANGQATFSTIHPGWYTGRTPHIHVKVRVHNASGNVTKTFTTQMFFTEAQNTTALSKSIYAHGTRTVFNSNDNVYSVTQADGTKLGAHLMLDTTQSASGETASFALAFAL